jgi:hypothetical protein
MKQPTTEDFVRALKVIGKAPGHVAKILRAHYEAPGRVATVSRLKESVPYKSWAGVNLQYGLFADKVAATLGVEPPETRLFLLCDFVAKKKQSNEHWQLVMRPEFAAALKTAKWV